MVSILSFFNTKKKPKRAAPPSPSASSIRESAQDTHGLSQRPRSSSKFLSLRHKAAAKLHDTSARRASLEVSRRRNQKQITVEPSEELLPKLNLGFEARAADEDQDVLGLGPLGRPVVLREEEKQVLKDLRWGVEEVKLAWEWFGGALKATGLDTRGIMLPRGLDADQTTQSYLFALYALCTNPDLLPSLPSISSQIANPTSDQNSEAWRERLINSLKDTVQPVNIAESLKLILRRLVPSVPDTDSLINKTIYTNFVQSEHASSYPFSAYGELFSPSVGPTIQSYLNEMFELWTAIAIQSEQNGMTAGKVAYLLGWWACGMNVKKHETWGQLYNNWQEAGKRLEHLLYAWIRFQTIKQKLPTRLLQIVEDYPFGEASASTQHLPLPPPSSFPRRTLQITLGSSVPLAEAVDSPEAIIEAALSATVDEKTIAPLWKSLVGAKKSVLEIVAEDSLNFFRQMTYVPAEPLSPTSQLSLLQTVEDEPLYRPFSGDYSRDQFHAGSDSSINRGPAFKQTATSSVEKNQNAPAWDDFEKIGFSEVLGDTTDLGLAFSPAVDKSAMANSYINPKLKTQVQTGQKAKKTTFHDESRAPVSGPTYNIMEEKVIDIDDVFISFVEDGQSDNVSDIWPPFSLIRLASTIPCGNDKPVEWLLVTLEHHPLVPEPSDPEMIERPTSPSATSVISRTGRGLRDFVSLSSLRRATSFSKLNGNRRSFFGSSAKKDDLPNVTESNPENEGKRPVKKLKIGEMGEIIKDTEPANGIQSVSKEKAVVSANAVMPVSESHKVVSGETSIDDIRCSADPATETVSSDWLYIAEGGAHIVFSYRGNNPNYVNKALRVRKPTADNYSLDLQRKWRDILPTLLPAELLVSCEEVTLDQLWLKDLLEKAEEKRPAKRKEGTAMAELVYVKECGLLMEDITSYDDDEVTTLTIEIKPKWGFLPSGHLEPPESIPIKTQVSRFRLHQHFRGYEDTGYDPLDLFSSDEKNVWKAIEGLWSLWKRSQGERNNWMVFVDGHKLKPDQISRIPTAESGDIVASTAPFIFSVLQTSHVLDHIQRLQHELDPLDISDLSKTWQDAHPSSPLFDPELIPDIDVAELKEFIDIYLSEPTLSKHSDGWNLRQRLIAYTLSSTFKDCSVLIKCPFQRNAVGEWGLVEGKASAKIIDLDLKSIHKLRVWAETDEKLWRYWLETKGNMEIQKTEKVANRETKTENSTLKTTDTRLDNASTQASSAHSSEIAHIPSPLFVHRGGVKVTLPIQDAPEKSSSECFPEFQRDTPEIGNQTVEEGREKNAHQPNEEHANDENSEDDDVFGNRTCSRATSTPPQLVAENFPAGDESDIRFEAAEGNRKEKSEGNSTKSISTKDTAVSAVETTAVGSVETATASALNNSITDANKNEEKKTLQETYIPKIQPQEAAIDYAFEKKKLTEVSHPYNDLGFPVSAQTENPTDEPHLVSVNNRPVAIISASEIDSSPMVMSYTTQSGHLETDTDTTSARDDHSFKQIHNTSKEIIDNTEQVFPVPVQSHESNDSFSDPLQKKSTAQQDFEEKSVGTFANAQLEQNAQDVSELPKTEDNVTDQMNTANEDVQNSYPALKSLDLVANGNDDRFALTSKYAIHDQSPQIPIENPSTKPSQSIFPEPIEFGSVFEATRTVKNEEKQVSSVLNESDEGDAEIVHDNVERNGALEFAKNTDLANEIFSEQPPGGLAQAALQEKTEEQDTCDHSSQNSQKDTSIGNLNLDTSVDALRDNTVEQKLKTLGFSSQGELESPPVSVSLEDQQVEKCLPFETQQQDRALLPSEETSADAHRNEQKVDSPSLLPSRDCEQLGLIEPLKAEHLDDMSAEKDLEKMATSANDLISPQSAWAVLSEIYPSNVSQSNSAASVKGLTSSEAKQLENKIHLDDNEENRNAEPLVEKVMTSVVNHASALRGYPRQSTTREDLPNNYVDSQDTSKLLIANPQILPTVNIDIPQIATEHQNSEHKKHISTTPVGSEQSVMQDCESQKISDPVDEQAEAGNNELSALVEPQTDSTASLNSESDNEGSESHQGKVDSATFPEVSIEKSFETSNLMSAPVTSTSQGDHSVNCTDITVMAVPLTLFNDEIAPSAPVLGSGKSFQTTPLPNLNKEAKEHNGKTEELDPMSLIGKETAEPSLEFEKEALGQIAAKETSDTPTTTKEQTSKTPTSATHQTSSKELSSKLPASESGKKETKGDRHVFKGQDTTEFSFIANNLPGKEKRKICGQNEQECSIEDHKPITGPNLLKVAESAVKENMPPESTQDTGIFDPVENYGTEDFEDVSVDPELEPVATPDHVETRADFPLSEEKLDFENSDGDDGDDEGDEDDEDDGGDEYIADNEDDEVQNYLPGTPEDFEITDLPEDMARDDGQQPGEASPIPVSPPLEVPRDKVPRDEVALKFDK
ncbi:uncharacterized protein L203_105846 [Cryptococcus depauperatus CBS 7841]|uniref:Inositol-pentakisphosphate 2-kinase n=1 Tax=Cryptococcus depauperatus CBS 7841 TaxID=1295531 RepID=A0AAJ8JY78_9TREE